MRIAQASAPEYQTLASSEPAALPLRVINESHPRLTSEGARVLLGQAWQAVVGGPPPPTALLLLSAQWAVETDFGRSMPGHNFGGIKAAPSAAGASFRTSEGYGATRRQVTARFRVYDSAETAARDYVRLLATRYPGALDAARAGDTSGFASALAAGGYFTAQPLAYARALEQHLVALRGGATPSSSPSLLGSVRESALSGLLRALCREPQEA